MQFRVVFLFCVTMALNVVTALAGPEHQGNGQPPDPTNQRRVNPPTSSDLPWTPTTTSQLKSVCSATFKPDRFGNLGAPIKTPKANTVYEVFDSNIGDTVFYMTDANGELDRRPLGEDSVFPCSSVGFEGSACTFSSERPGAVFKVANGSPSLSLTKLTPVLRADFPTKFAWQRTTETPVQPATPNPPVPAPNPNPPTSNPSPMPPPQTPSGPAAGMKRVPSDIGEVDIPIGMIITFVDRANNRVYYGPESSQIASVPPPQSPTIYSPPPFFPLRRAQAPCST